MEKNIDGESEGMATYEYIVNNVDTCRDEMPELIEKLEKVDTSGQFLASTARFLNAVDSESFKDSIPRLVEGAINKDRERRYIWSLLEALWGKDYKDHAEELAMTDNNFRRIYKRLFPVRKLPDTGIIHF